MINGQGPELNWLPLSSIMINYMSTVARSTVGEIYFGSPWFLLLFFEIEAINAKRESRVQNDANVVISIGMLRAKNASYCCISDREKDRHWRCIFIYSWGSSPATTQVVPSTSAPHMPAPAPTSKSLSQWQTFRGYFLYGDTCYGMDQQKACVNEHLDRVNARLRATKDHFRIQHPSTSGTTHGGNDNPMA